MPSGLPSGRLAVACAALLLAACASTRAPVAASDLDAGRPIALRVGQSAVISLPVDRNAGYGWTLAQTTLDVLAQDGEPGYVAETGSGAPASATGSEIWRFTAMRRGRDELRFEYRRDDAPEQAPARVLRFEVRAR